MSKKLFLDTISSEIIVCTKCRLWKSRIKAVPGEGSPDSQVMFIGEGPGRMEDIEGRPFVGPAGKFLNNLISSADMVRENVFICNMVRCRPPRNRDPRPDEIKACTPYLERQIAVIQPKFIVTLGTHSAAYIFSKAKLPFLNITRVRGKAQDVTILGLQMTVFPTFHPAAFLHNPSYKQALLRDFQRLKKEFAERKATI